MNRIVIFLAGALCGVIGSKLVNDSKNKSKNLSIANCNTTNTEEKHTLDGSKDFFPLDEEEAE